MDLDVLERSDKVVAGSGIVLVVVLVFLPWHSFQIGPVALTWSAIEGRHVAPGVLATLLTALVVVVILVRAMRPDVELPDVPGGWDRAVLVASTVVAGLLVLKLGLDPSRVGVGAWLALGLAAAMVAGASLRHRPAPVDVAE